MYIYIHPSIYLSIYLSLYLSIYLFIYFRYFSQPIEWKNSNGNPLYVKSKSNDIYNIYIYIYIYYISIYIYKHHIYIFVHNFETTICIHIYIDNIDNFKKFKRVINFFFLLIEVHYRNKTEFKKTEKF